MPTDITSRLRSFLQRPNPVLFAGAGVAARVGYPTWNQYIIHLADVCEQFKDSAAAALIRSRLADGQHLPAATVFKTSHLIPIGERWTALAAPFARDPQDLDKLDGLIRLPFGSIVTTNYDRSLHHAYSQVFGKWVTPIERDNLRAGSHSREYFIARIHGSADNPTSMAVDVADYDNLSKNDDYLDFVLSLLQTRSCFFFGFSFLDPAIRHVLSIHADRHGPTFRRIHLALIPSGQTDLRQQLHAVNIDVLEYDSSDGHLQAWRAIRTLADSYSTDAFRPVPSIDPTFGHSALHHFLAFTDAQARTRQYAQPITEIARDGLIASLVSSPSQSVSEELLRDKAATLLGLSSEEARRVVTTSLDRLATRDCVTRNGSQVTWIGPTTFGVDRDLQQLADNVVHRMQVRYGARATPKDRQAALILIENVLLTRAWDIAAQFARGASGFSANARDIIDETLNRLPTAERPTHGSQLCGSLQGLLHKPENRDAEILTRLGRVAFGVQLVLASPRQTLFHQYALPRSVYLDASVLLPTIVPGHPLETTYTQVITRLAAAVRQTGLTFFICVGHQFLNEIVAHRERSIEMVEAGNLEDPEALRRHIQYHSAISTNVFVGAYGTTVATDSKPPTFAEFLDSIAPYTDETQLTRYLDEKGIKTIKMNIKNQFSQEYLSIRNRLETAYETIDRRKSAILVEHEAQQLTQLKVDVDAGISSVFVTADGKLRRAVASVVELRGLSGSLLSHLGLVALADVIAGIDGTDAVSLARLMWLTADTGEEKELVEYFVTLGLRKYDENMSADLQSLAERCAAEAAAEAKAQKLDLSSATKQPDKKNRFLDRFENHFYEYWDEAIRRRQREAAENMEG